MRRHVVFDVQARCFAEDCYALLEMRIPMLNNVSHVQLDVASHCPRVACTVFCFTRCVQQFVERRTTTSRYVLGVNSIADRNCR